MIDTGSGPAVVLLHGFPHTPRLWDRVVPRLAEHHRVLAPELVAGAPALELAARLAGLLDERDVERAALVAIDAGVPAAVGFAVSRPERTERLCVMEAVLPAVPGAEQFLAGPPWWFGFHQVPGLAERVLVGHERDYVEWFLRAGTADGRGVGGELTDAFAAAYAGRERLAAAFEHYRAMPRNAEELAPMLTRGALDLPVLAVGAHPVGPALAAQLREVAGDLTEVQLEDCGHLVPLDAPERLLEVLEPWLARGLRREAAALG